MAITYKSIIANAIGDFNSIQNALATKSTTIATTADSSADSSLVATNLLPGKIRDYLVFPSGNLAITGSGTFKVATDVSDGTNRTGYATVSVAAAGAVTLSLTDKSTTTLSVGNESSGYYPVTTSLSGNVNIATAGWITAGNKSVTDSSVVVGRLPKATFSVSGNKVTASAAGWIVKDASVGTISGGSASVTSTASLVTTLGSGTEDVGTTIFSTDTSSGTFYKLVFNESLTKSVKAGYITDVSLTDAAATTKYIRQSTHAKASATSDAATLTITPAQQANISAGFYSSNRIIKVDSTATAAAANILSGKTAWVNGSSITGSMKNNGAITATSNPSLSGTKVSYSYTVPAGYHNGSGTVKGELDLGSSTLTALAPAFTVFDGGASSALSSNIFAKSTDGLSGYYRIEVKSKAKTTTGYETADNKTGSADTYYLPKATFGYISDNPDMIECLTPGYVTAGDIAATGSIDYADISGTLNSSIGDTATNTDSSLFLTDAPSDLSTAYKIYSTHTVNSAGYVNTSSTFTDTPRYIKKGVVPATLNLGYGASATIPAGFYESAFTIKNNIGAGTIDVVDSTSNSITAVTIGAKSGSTYPITASKSVTVSSTVTTAGYVSSSVGTKNTGIVKVDVNATIPAGSLSCGAATQIANTTSPTAASGKAITTTSDKTHVYVGLTRPAVTVTDGYITDDLAANTSGKAYIPAVLSPTISVTGVGGSGSVGAPTIFDGTNGSITTVGSKSNSISVSKSATDTANKDKYIITSIKINASGSATANIAADATGSNVDSYVESLYKRMLGLSYTAVADDAGNSY